MSAARDLLQPAHPTRARWWRRVVIASLGGVLLAGLVAVPGGMVAVSNNPAFCGSCHEMLPAYETWRRSVHGQPEKGKVATCQDCHHPPGLSGQFAAGLRGIVHISSHLFRSYDEAAWARAEPTRANRARALIPNEVCIRCHPLESTAPYLTTVVHSRIDRSIRCVDCHRDLMRPKRLSRSQLSGRVQRKPLAGQRFPEGDRAAGQAEPPASKP